MLLSFSIWNFEVTIRNQDLYPVCGNRPNSYYIGLIYYNRRELNVDVLIPLSKYTGKTGYIADIIEQTYIICMSV